MKRFIRGEYEWMGFMFCATPCKLGRFIKNPDCFYHIKMLQSFAVSNATSHPLSNKIRTCLKTSTRWTSKSGNKKSSFVGIRIQGQSSWLNSIKKNLSSEEFSYKNWKILNPPIFSEKFADKIIGAVSCSDFWKISTEYFHRNTNWKYEFGNFQKSDHICYLSSKGGTGSNPG